MKDVFITDLDGTLLDSEGALSQTSRDILEELIEAGVAFTVASARSIDSIRAVITDLPLQMPVIEFNGSYITDYHTGEKLHVNSIDRSLNRPIFDVLHNLGLSMIVTCHEEGNDYLHYDSSTYNELAARYVHYRKSHGSTRLKDHSDLETVASLDIVCINAIDREDKIRQAHDALINAFGDALEVHMMKGTYRDQEYWLNVADPRGTKGQALKTFREMFLTESDRLYVFGDNNNDIGMFEVADFPVALENSVETLKEMAAETIGYNYDDSVAHYIMRKAGEQVEKNR